MEEEVKSKAFYVGELVRCKTGDEWRECGFGYIREMDPLEGHLVTIEAVYEYNGRVQAIKVREYPGEAAFTSNQFEKIDVEQEEQKEKEVEKIKFSYPGEPTQEEIDEMISLVDLATFQKIIQNRVLSDIEYYDDFTKTEIKSLTKAWVKKYLQDWAKAKYRFYKMFGDKLTIEDEIETNKDENEFRREYSEIMAKFPLYKVVLNAISFDDIYKNEMCDLSDFILEDKRVKNGMKFTQFISLYGCKELDMEISKLYQNKGKSKIFISINPIDYLTVSINRSDWRSCHNFFDGEYRNAGLSYMNDKTSLVAYSANGMVDYTRYERPFTWNSKKWRQMIYVSEESSTTVFSRQYPCESTEMSKGVRLLWEKYIDKYFNISFVWKVFNHRNDANIEVEKKCCTLYNDVGNGFGHKVIKNKADINYDEKENIYIGDTIRAINNFEVEIVDEGETLWE